MSKQMLVYTAQHDMPAMAQSLYQLWTEAGIDVYNAQHALVGTTTAYKAIAHNGKCIGSIQVDTGDTTAWISGRGFKTEEGIQWTEFGTKGHNYFLSRGNTLFIP